MLDNGGYTGSIFAAPNQPRNGSLHVIPLTTYFLIHPYETISV